MNEEKLLTVREASLILGISEKEVLDLAESGAIPAYKIGGVYLSLPMAISCKSLCSEAMISKASIVSLRRRRGNAWPTYKI